MPWLQRLAYLPALVALATVALKALAWRITGSVGFLSDALESLVNVVSGLITLTFFSWAARPPDEEHAYGHTKAEYFASALVGGLILVAAVGIGTAAVPRFFAPQPMLQIDLGLGLVGAATLLNAGAGIVLIQVGRRAHAIALEAEGQHLLTDVWTSLAVLVGVGAAAWLGWLWLDPVVALGVAAHIAWVGARLIYRSANGLLDAALPPEKLNAVRRVLDGYAQQGISYHALRTRQAARRCFISVHVLVPGHWSVREGHALLERIEADLRAAVPNATVFTHLEPLDEACAWEDQGLDRTSANKATR
ncbi:MAG: cation diffusion facilitator family transporter [Thermoflexales bacterium]|nr:cation diffusion facilitator family transporter [Thermoflexales bacterium]MCS7324456.1 cation diffusion facilitator family transporter [Thermoflexales bacterium]MDW8054275.1 cation diffusion facilitator family transporter [Anaerolineae bacterium]MDW8291563.1 cation diffusion facilitator family transporter [Anaerolineae bacterium]